MVTGVALGRKIVDMGAKRQIFAFAFAAVLIGGVAWAAAGLKIVINGKQVDGEVLKVDGKMYVPVSALKAAGCGVTYDDKSLSINFAAGGANQQNGVEGSIGDWLFDGIWRLQVKSIDRQTDADGTGGWKLVVEIRNGTKFDGYSPGGTGWQGATLVLADGTSVPSRSDSPDLRDQGLNQGAGNTQSLYFDTDSSSQPDRFILRFDPKGLEGTPLKFTVADPSFRVSLKKQ